MIRPDGRTVELREELLAEIARRLSTALSPRAIYLFGSYAYGEPAPDSDVDLMIVTSDSDELSSDYLKRAYGCLRGSFLPIELHFRPHSKFDRRRTVETSLEHDVATKGRLVCAA
jgi:predicted nucleotidyltransferase